MEKHGELFTKMVSFVPHLFCNVKFLCPLISKVKLFLICMEYRVELLGVAISETLIITIALVLRFAQL